MKHGDTAHIPGKGPKDTYCIDCKHFDRVVSKCAKHAEMRKTSLMAIRPIPSGTAACKYFEART